MLFHANPNKRKEVLSNISNAQIDRKLFYSNKVRLCFATSKFLITLDKDNRVCIYCKDAKRYFDSASIIKIVCIKHTCCKGCY